MGKNVFLGALVLSALGIATLGGCNSSKSGAGAGADSGSSSADSGSNPDSIPAPDAPNPLCPQGIDPVTGIYAPKGKCCYRTANSTRVKAQGDGALDVLEYRVNYSQTVNHPMSLGVSYVAALTKTVAEAEQQSQLFRFWGPRGGGAAVSGPGKVQVGYGRYNCGKGTYSFFSNKAAPVRTDAPRVSDPARWQSHPMPTVIDVTKTAPEEAAQHDHVVWATNVNRDFSYTPYISMTTYKLDMELLTQGFEIEKLPSDDATMDCAGEIKSDHTGWTAAGLFRTYVNAEVNDHDGIDSLNNQTMCQLLGFGVVTGTTDPAYQCATTVRCTPGTKTGTKNCTWVKLPESLCPETAAEKAMWGCHVGDENNPDKEKTNCTADKVTTTLDPDKGAKTEGQCCDPLGKKTGGLPTCNAFLLRNEFVAAAAEITDEEADGPQENCAAH